MFELIADRSPDDERDLASQATLSRFENAIDIRSCFRLRDVFIDQFMASFEEPPRQLTLDLDAFDDPAHGQQQLVLFHGYYGQYQYLPVAWTCAENDMVRQGRGARVVPEGACDAYADRGESENRNKELKCGLHANRLSAHRYLANLFRLYLHCLAHNLQVRARQPIADPPPERLSHDELPPEALPEHRRRQSHNRRRRHDPLGEGQPCTWRTRLIKVAAEIRVSVRRILVRLPRHWPYLHHFEQLCTQAIALTHPARPPT